MTEIHPELRRIARFLPRSLAGPRLTPALRKLEPFLFRAQAEHAEDVRIGPISVRLHRPPARDDGPHPALQWIHGGGYVFGRPEQDDARCAEIAHRFGMVVAAVDYRVAPEHPFPTPLHDCHDALVWLANRDDVNAERIAIGGASAGGGLTAALALLARDRGEVRPIVQLLSYPMVDDRTAVRTDIDESCMRVWNNKSNRYGWTSYLGMPPGAPAVSGLAAPARHDDLSGLPPAWIGVGNLDLFHDEDVAYAERLSAAGVACELVIVEGAFHGFDLVRRASIVKQFQESQRAALAAGLGIDEAGG